MSDQQDGFWVTTCIVGFGIGMCLMSLIYSAIFSSDTRRWRSEAVSRGYAEYVVDEFGDTTWKWKEPAQ